MPNQVYVHIGLPKTATTTLQLDYFPYVNNDQYQYLGVFQPREKQVQDSLVVEVISAVRSGYGLVKVNEALIERLDIEQRSLIISEEMLTVGSAEVTWQEQLSNLSKILYGIDHKVLVTVREPVSAMFSFYLELYDRFQDEKSEFSDLALFDNNFRIYHYDELLNELAKYFEIERIYIQKFEDLVQKKFTTVECFLDHPEKEKVQKPLNNHNQRNRNGSNVMVSKRLKLSLISRTYQKCGGDTNWLALTIKKLTKQPIQKIRSINYGSVPVSVLTDDERMRLKQSMAGTMDVMAERFGVRY